ncbi:hypothetical protein GCM10027293_36090 [Pontibacter aydingkolensis]
MLLFKRDGEDVEKYNILNIYFEQFTPLISQTENKQNGKSNRVTRRVAPAEGA